MAPVQQQPSVPHGVWNCPPHPPPGVGAGLPLISFHPQLPLPQGTLFRYKDIYDTVILLYQALHASEGWLLQATFDVQISRRKPVPQPQQYTYLGMLGTIHENAAAIARNGTGAFEEWNNNVSDNSVLSPSVNELNNNVTESMLVGSA